MTRAGLGYRIKDKLEPIFRARLPLVPFVLGDTIFERSSVGMCVLQQCGELVAFAS